MKIVIIGTDEYGKYVYECATRHSLNYEVIGFMEWGLAKENNEFLGKPVFSLDEIQIRLGSEIDAIFIAITTNRYLSLTLQALHEANIKEAYLIPLFTLETKKDVFSEKLTETEKIQCLDLTKPNLAHLETHVVDYCNLKCKACNNFSPFFKNEEASVEKFIEDLNVLKEKIDLVCRLFLLGGEPLLNPDKLIKFLVSARKVCKKTEIRVITNGTLLLSVKKELFQCMNEMDAIFQVSLYPPMEEKKEQIENLLKLNGVKYIISEKVSHFIKRLTLSPNSSPESAEKVCGSAGCTYFRDGRISKCPDSILVGKFDERFLTSIQTKESIALDEQLDGFDLQKRINNPIDMCKYCAEKEVLVEWEQVKDKIDKDDWIVTDEEMELIKDGRIELEERNRAVEKRNLELEERNRAVENRNSELEERNCVVEKRNSELEERNHVVEKRNSELEERNHVVEKRNSELEERNREVEKRIIDVEDYNSKMDRYIINLGNRVEEISYGNQQLVNVNNELRAELERIENTVIWRINSLFHFAKFKALMDSGKRNAKKILFLIVAISMIAGSICYTFETFNRKNVTIGVRDASAFAMLGQTGTITVLLDNHRMTSVDSSDEIFLSYHLMDSNGDVYNYEGLRTSIDVPARTQKDVEMRFIAPNEKGEYIIQIDLLREGSYWFSDKGNKVCEVLLTVE